MTMTRKQRIQILMAARLAVANGQHETARTLFALVGVSYVAASETHS